jgi:hypothetical protein
LKYLEINQESRKEEEEEEEEADVRGYNGRKESFGYTEANHCI